MNNYEEARDKQVNEIEDKLDALIDALGFDASHTVLGGCKLTKKIKKPSYSCTKCGTHIAPGNSITSCLCKATKNLIRID
jgi:Zn finger protein HypA/HybF involved in hydrogenase expression